MPASIFTNNDKPISRREDEGKVGFTPSISPNQRETLNPAASPAKLQSPSRQTNG